jgi:hypothetical protein
MKAVWMTPSAVWERVMNCLILRQNRLENEGASARTLVRRIWMIWKKHLVNTSSIMMFWLNWSQDGGSTLPFLSLWLRITAGTGGGGYRMMLTTMP